MGCHSGIGDRKIHGNLKRVIEKPSTLAEHTPKGWKKIMEDEGRVPKPLNNGAFKGVPFEDGGGYKINFEEVGNIYLCILHMHLYYFHMSIQFHFVLNLL